MLSQEISLHRRPNFDIGRRHFETSAQWPGKARPLKETSNRTRDFVVFILYSRLWLIFNLAVLSQNVCFLTPEDSKKRKRRSKRSLRRHIIGVLVSDAKSCQRKENVFVSVKSVRQKTKWNVEFYVTSFIISFAYSPGDKLPMQIDFEQE